MQTDAQHAATNVVRFPVERRARPTIELMRELAPSAHEVAVVLGAFDLPGPPPDLRRRTDAETAARILGAGVDGRPTPPGDLDQLLDPMVAAAIAACWSARDLAAAAAGARQTWLRARKAGVGPLGALRARLEALRLRAAAMLVKAHAGAEEAEGAARAVGFARRGEPWTPPSPHRGGDAALEAAAPTGFKSTVRPRATRTRSSP